MAARDRTPDGPGSPRRSWRLDVRRRLRRRSRERDELLARALLAEREAAVQADIFASIVESMSAGLVVIDAAGQPMLGNRAARELLTPAGDLDAPPGPAQAAHAPGTPPDDISMLPVQDVLAGGTVASADVVIGGRPGAGHRIVNIAAAPMPDRLGGGAVLVLRDVTAARHQQEELTSFAGVVAHDLLNPLTAITGWSDLLASLLSRAAPDPMVSMATESLTWIHDGAQRASSLIGELLTYTTAADAPIAAADVDLAQIVGELIAERGRAPMSQALPPRRPPEFTLGRLDHVLADPVLIRQLLSNLIENAVKYVAPGSTAQITISSSEARPGWVCVQVADRGIGIPPGEHEAIFENFHRAHSDQAYPGSGIGLAICRRIAGRHGGTIRAEDNPGGGARFAVTLPAVPAGPSAALAQAGSEQHAGSPEGQTEPASR